MSKKYIITGIGNAIVDILVLVAEEFLVKHSLQKGSMNLINQAEDRVLSNLNYQKIQSGGSVANSIATLAMLGIDSSLIGKVGADKFGDVFFEDLKKINCDFHCQNRQISGSTAKSYVMITPDGNRTMSTYLGQAFDIASEIKPEIIAQSQFLFIEGYLWDRLEIINSLKEIISFAKKIGVKIAFTLSDSFCVKRHRQDFLELISQIDILFANQEEIKILASLADFLPHNYYQLKFLTKTNPDLIMSITLSENGALIMDQKQDFHLIPVKEVITKPIDSTGAGDNFAAGFLYGLAKDFSVQKAAEIGNLLASKVIQKIGARLDYEELRSIYNDKKFYGNMDFK